MWLTDWQEWINLLFRWKKYFFYGLDRIKEPQVFQFIVKSFPFRLVSFILWMRVERLFDSTEHMFGMSQIIVQLNLGHQSLDKFVISFTFRINLSVNFLFCLTNRISLWELYVSKVWRFSLFVVLVVEYKLLIISIFCVFGTLCLQKFRMLDVIWFS